MIKEKKLRYFSVFFIKSLFKTLNILCQIYGPACKQYIILCRVPISGFKLENYFQKLMK